MKDKKFNRLSMKMLEANRFPLGTTATWWWRVFSYFRWCIETFLLCKCFVYLKWRSCRRHWVSQRMKDCTIALSGRDRDVISLTLLNNSFPLLQLFEVSIIFCGLLIDDFTLDNWPATHLISFKTFNQRTELQLLYSDDRRAFCTRTDV